VPSGSARDAGFFEGTRIAARVLPTREAAALYNKLAENEAVGGLFHTTC